MTAVTREKVQTADRLTREGIPGLPLPPEWLFPQPVKPTSILRGLGRG